MKTIRKKNCQNNPFKDFQKAHSSYVFTNSSLHIDKCRTFFIQMIQCTYMFLKRLGLLQWYISSGKICTSSMRDIRTDPPPKTTKMCFLIKFFIFFLASACYALRILQFKKFIHQKCVSLKVSQVCDQYTALWPHKMWSYQYPEENVKIE